MVEIESGNREWKAELVTGNKKWESEKDKQLNGLEWTTRNARSSAASNAKYNARYYAIQDPMQDRICSLCKLSNQVKVKTARNIIAFENRFLADPLSA